MTTVKNRGGRPPIQDEFTHIPNKMERYMLRRAKRLQQKNKKEKIDGTR